MATGTGPLWERVRNAMDTLVMFSPEDIPDKFSREQFALLHYLSTDRQATGDEGDLAATLESLDTDAVRELAQTIVTLRDHLLRRTDERYAADQEPGASA